MGSSATGSPREDSNGDAGRLRALNFGLVQAAADDTQAQLVLIEAIDGRIRDRMETLKRVVLIVSHARRIPKQADREE
mgnify:CR=1 FL=1